MGAFPVFHEKVHRVNVMANYLASKPRYEILDGLRGVAAFLVVAFHLFETYSEGVTHQIINHGYLAVDFFFVLSGFVVGYAYDDRWGRMGMWPFFKRRLVRLHPLLVWGTFLGLLLFYFGSDMPDFARIGDVPVTTAVAVALLCMTMVPLPQAWDIRGWGEMNPLNGATWSLFWEYLANVAYALVIRHFSKGVLAGFVVCSAVFTVVLCMDIDVFGCLAERSYAAYTVIGGWSLSPDQLQIGITRLLYPFFCGLLLSRLFQEGTRSCAAGGEGGRGLRRSACRIQPSAFRVRGAFWWCSLAVVVMLAMPRVGGDVAENYWMNGLYEAVCILVVFPLVVVMGASSSTQGRTTAVNKFLGDISYPLYVTHYPLIYWQMSWAATHASLPAAVHVAVAVSLFFLAVGVAYASLRLYDEPVRSWLRQKLLS